jgi:hypothetical protein
MCDAANVESELVCKVSHETLSDRFQRDHANDQNRPGFDHHQAAATFERHRGRIKRIASAKFDAGEREIVVSTADLNG